MFFFGFFGDKKTGDVAGGGTKSKKKTHFFDFFVHKNILVIDSWVIV